MLDPGHVMLNTRQITWAHADATLGEYHAGAKFYRAAESMQAQPTGVVAGLLRDGTQPRRAPFR